MPTPALRKVKSIIEFIIFGSRWLLTIFYMGLIITMLAYTFVYIKEIYELIKRIGSLDQTTILMIALELVDIVMIANLIKMIITGSYNSFIDKTHPAEGEKVSSGMLKVKMAMSIIGVSSIHLLSSFINASDEKMVSWTILYKQLAIHATFLIGYLIMAYGNYLHDKAEISEEQNEHNSHKPEKHETTSPKNVEHINS